MTTCLPVSKNTLAIHSISPEQRQTPATRRITIQMTPRCRRPAAWTSPAPENYGGRRRTPAGSGPVTVTATRPAATADLHPDSLPRAAIARVDSASALTASAFSFQVTATSFPAAQFTKSGTPPSGVTSGRVPQYQVSGHDAQQGSIHGNRRLDLGPGWATRPASLQLATPECP